MAHEMFGDVVDPSITVGTKQWYTVPLSILAHVIALMGLVIVPLVAAGALPTPDTVIAFVVAPPPPPQPAPPETPRATAPPPVTTPVNLDAAPTDAPLEITPEPPPRSFTSVSGVLPGTMPIGVPTTGLTSLSEPPPLPPQVVRPGGDIKEPRKIREVRPVYPAVAMAAKVEGVVIIEATLSQEGRVIDARVIKSHALLDQAALDAVRQWTFTPTTLNGAPVEVIMTITVNFRLQ